MSAEARARALSELARFQITDTTVGEALQRIARITEDAVQPAAFIGMTMLGEDGRPTTAVCTDEDAPEIDAAQYAEGTGPCLDAWRENRVLRVERVDERADEYPAFAAACRARGVASTLSLPIPAGDVAIGALNLYARTPEAFGDDDEALAADLAAAAGSILANVSAYWSAFELSQQLTEAMTSRAVIEQAKGMIMARDPHLTADEAFDVLRRASQRENVKLREIAARIVGRREPSNGEDGPT